MEKKENLNKNYPSLLVPLDIAGKLKKIGFSDETGLFKYNREKGLIFKRRLIAFPREAERERRGAIQLIFI